MITREYLAGLSHEEKDEIILKQAARIRELEMQITRLEARIARLEAMIMGKKTSKNSSNPPSRDQKANIPGKKK